MYKASTTAKQIQSTTHARAHARGCEERGDERQPAGKSSLLDAEAPDEPRLRKVVNSLWRSVSQGEEKKSRENGGMAPKLIGENEG